MNDNHKTTWNEDLMTLLDADRRLLASFAIALAS